MARRPAHVASRRTQRRSLFILFVPLVVAFTMFVFERSVASFKSQQLLPDFSCGGKGPQSDATGQFEEGAQFAWFNNEQVAPLAHALPIPTTVVLGESAGEKWIDVDLSTQTLRAMEGDHQVYEFKISSGKWAPTQTGEYRIWSKFRYTKMSGGSKADNTYYYLPNVPYVMYFNQGVGLHGTYWHNNFGHPMSHGCVNMATPDAEKIFYWADPAIPEGSSAVRATKDNPGTRVVVHGEAPRN